MYIGVRIQPPGGGGGGGDNAIYGLCGYVPLWRVWFSIVAVYYGIGLGI